MENLRKFVSGEAVALNRLETSRLIILLNGRMADWFANGQYLDMCLESFDEQELFEVMYILGRNVTNEGTVLEQFFIGMAAGKNELSIELAEKDTKDLLELMDAIPMEQLVSCTLMENINLCKSLRHVCLVLSRYGYVVSMLEE